MRFHSSSLKIENVFVSTGTDPWHTQACAARHWTRMCLPGPAQQGLQALCGEGTEPRDPSSSPRRRASWTPQPRTPSHVPLWDPRHQGVTSQTRITPKGRPAQLTGFSSSNGVWQEPRICVWITLQRNLWTNVPTVCGNDHEATKNSNIWILPKKNGNIFLFYKSIPFFWFTLLIIHAILAQTTD